MAVKVTGYEWKKFYTDKDPEFWPEGAWHDDEEVLVNGQEVDGEFSHESVADTDTITITGGIVFMRERDTDGPSLETHFKRWRKKQNTAILMVEVPRGDLEALKAAIAAAGGKVAG